MAKHVRGSVRDIAAQTSLLSTLCLQLATGDCTFIPGDRTGQVEAAAAIHAALQQLSGRGAQSAERAQRQAGFATELQEYSRHLADDAGWLRHFAGETKKRDAELAPAPTAAEASALQAVETR